MLVVLGAVLQSVDTGVRTEAGHRARSEALDEIRLAMNRLTKDARQAVWVAPTSGASRLEMSTLLNGAAHDVVYELVGTTLQRSVDGGPATPLVSRVVSGTDTFTYDPDPAAATPGMIGIAITLEPRGLDDSDVTLTTRVYLRNSASP